MFFDFLVVKGHIPFNPALSVKAPRYSQTTGKTPYFVDDEPRILLDSIETDTLIGLRDRAMISAMLYTFARVSAVVHMRVEDYFLRGRRSFLSLHEKGGVVMSRLQTTSLKRRLMLISISLKSGNNVKVFCFAVALVARLFIG